MQTSFTLKDTHGNRVDLQVDIQVSLLDQELLGNCPTNSGTCRTPGTCPAHLLIHPCHQVLSPVTSTPIPSPCVSVSTGLETPSFLSLAHCPPLAQGQNSLHIEWNPLFRAVPWPFGAWLITCSGYFC